MADDDKLAVFFHDTLEEIKKEVAEGRPLEEIFPILDWWPECYYVLENPTNSATAVAIWPEKTITNKDKFEEIFGFEPERDGHGDPDAWLSDGRQEWWNKPYEPPEDEKNEDN